MASNPYVNKVQKADGTVLMDISDSTVKASDLRDGIIAYDKSGAKIIGEMDTELIVSGGGTVTLISENDYKITFSR